MSSTIIEIRDPDEARDWLLHGLWLQRVAVVNGAAALTALEWAREIAAEGDPLPLVGFVADLGHLVFQAEHPRGERRSLPGIEDGLLRTYEDYVLGKLYADHSFERAADAVEHYEGRDRARGLRYLVDRVRDRAGFEGVHVNPAVVKGLFDEKPDELLAASWESLSEEGPHPLVAEQLAGLVTAIRNLGDVLAPEDVFELEHRTALADFGQRLALRQVFRAAAALETTLPPRPAGIKQRRQEVATRMLDEDAYPIGGFTSISNKGTIESLLHSQLAYMETDDAQRPDLFEVRFVRDELLYYSRDENAFLRRRRTFTFALFPDLVEARIKDPELDWQRIVLLLAVILVAIRRTTDWLGDDSLVFEILFVEDAPLGEVTLDDERSLLEMMLREQIANGTVSLESIGTDRLLPHAEDRARTSTCHLVACSVRDRDLEVESALLTRCVTSRPELQLGFADEPLGASDSARRGDTGFAETAFGSWAAGLVRVLEDFASS